MYDFQQFSFSIFFLLLFHSLHISFHSYICSSIKNDFIVLKMLLYKIGNCYCYCLKKNYYHDYDDDSIVFPAMYSISLHLSIYYVRENTRERILLLFVFSTCHIINNYELNGYNLRYCLIK